ncbi:MAG: hypothetical protein KIT80_18385 [Chitinophagaceae bacterium]|nr:hypothetical protein [Chitinophagaceae bacterium]MCW5928894.1 hypothetical protein [Chitinophagaceae bacterium]
MKKRSGRISDDIVSIQEKDICSSRNQGDADIIVVAGVLMRTNGAIFLRKTNGFLYYSQIISSARLFIRKEMMFMMMPYMRR